uniref:Angiomotin_C domain-containing protein n=1 Tax=Heterorhabditis bacteriophora TaxID=37862 RepID=A0A1I7XKM9_HETBA
MENRVYSTPTAVVGPRKGYDHRHHYGNACGLSYNQTEEQTIQEHYRRSLQGLNSSCPYNLSNTSYNEWPSGALSITDDMIRGQNMKLKNSPGTPQSQRRSVQYNNRLNSSGISHFDHSVVTSTPIQNKVAVAPQPQTHKGRHLNHKEIERDLTRNNQHLVSPLERRESNAGAIVLSSYQPYLRHNGDERLVDGPSSPKDLRVASLEQRVKELEAMVVGSGQASTSLVIPVTPTSQSKHGHNRSSAAPSTQLIISNSSPASSMTQQLMAKEVVIKEVEIERLQAKLRKTYAQMERQQLEYSEEVRRFTKDSETAKAELLRVVNKLNELEAESNRYREKAINIDNSQNPVLTELQAKLKHQEKELARLRFELAEKERLEKAYSDVKQQLEYLELQNETLNKTLDDKEGIVKELEQNIVQNDIIFKSMRMEATLYHQSCSSGSTPLADETESLADIRPPLYSNARPYTKAHSTLGANLSPLPTPKSGLTKSLSNYAIDSNRRDDVSSSMSRTDSMSESETEQVAFDSTAMTMGVAEKMMRRQEEGMCRLEKDLDAIRYLVQDCYQAKIGDTLSGSDDACRIQ